MQRLAGDQYTRHKCDSVLSMEVAENEGGYCWRIVKNLPVIFPMPEFEHTLVSALDFFTRTKLRD
jgi:hypothetical protein